MGVDRYKGLAETCIDAKISGKVAPRLAVIMTRNPLYRVGRHPIPDMGLSTNEEWTPTVSFIGFGPDRL